MNDVLKVNSAFDGHLIREYSLAGLQEIENALDRTYSVFRDRSKWIPKYRRIEILEKLALLMEAQQEDLIRLATEEGGKPYQDTKVELLRAINGVKIAIAELYNLKGEEIPMGLTAPSTGRLAFTTREPIGVVLSISAFNHPLNLIIHQVVPAIATGCPVIVKPASTTPNSCFKIVELLYEAGLAEDHCIPLVCSRELAEKMVRDPRINFLSFIGSAEVGWHLRSILAPGTRIALEHGGVAPVIIDKTADIDSILPGLVKGAFYHAGQVCVSVQKIFVHESIAREVADKISIQVQKLKTGNPLDHDTDVGPLIDPKEIDRVDSWIKEASGMGATIMCGGERLGDTLYQPTVIWQPSAEAKVSKSEVFGPVVCIYPFKEVQEAVESANSLPFAFQAAVYSKDIDFVLSVSQKLNASAVMINDHTAFRVDWMPFGGRDASGIGTGGIPYSMKDMTREKLIVMKSHLLD